MRFTWLLAFLISSCVSVRRQVEFIECTGTLQQCELEATYLKCNETHYTSGYSCTYAPNQVCKVHIACINNYP